MALLYIIRNLFFSSFPSSFYGLFSDTHWIFYCSKPSWHIRFSLSIIMYFLLSRLFFTILYIVIKSTGLRALVRKNFVNNCPFLRNSLKKKYKNLSSRCLIFLQNYKFLKMRDFLLKHINVLQSLLILY